MDNISAQIRLWWNRFRIQDYLNILLIINVSFYILSIVVAVIIQSSIQSLDYLGANWLITLTGFQFWRLISSAFLHSLSNPFHIIFNLFALYQLGKIIQHYYGDREMVIVYVVGAIVSGLFSLISSFASLLLFDNGFSISVGASGAIFAMLGLIIGTQIFSRRFGTRLPINTNMLLLIAAYNLFFGFAIPGIDNAAHIGGLLCGLLLSLLIEPKGGYNLVAWRSQLIKWGFRISVGLTFVSLSISLIYLTINLIV
jgi:rhomboid protease GluP